MKNNAFEGRSLAEAYEKALSACFFEYDYLTEPRGQKIRELVNTKIRVTEPNNNLFETQARPFPKRYLAGELLWYFSGSNNISGILPYSKFWKNIQNPDGSLNSAYGNLIFKKTNQCGLNQWQWAYSSLAKDKDSRQAIMHFNMPEHQNPNFKDFVCTLSVQFLIREDKLHMIVNMSCNDLIRGLTFDYPFFNLLQQQMCRHLIPLYPKLEVGFYDHLAGSTHIYEEHFGMVEDMLSEGIKESALPELDYDFVDPDGQPKHYLQLDSRLFNWISENKLPDV